MAKTASRKHAGHRKARVHHAVRKQARRSAVPPPLIPQGFEAVKPESESIGDEAALQAESRAVEDDTNDDADRQ